MEFPMNTGILWLEGDLSGKRGDKYTTRPLAEMLSTTIGIPVEFHTTLTPEEFGCHLERFKASRYPFVYMTCHGKPGKLMLHNLIHLKELAGLVGDGLAGRLIHFSSCLVLKDQKASSEFKEVTGLRSISGYTRSVARLESSLLDSLVLQAMLRSRGKAPYIRRRLKKTAVQLVGSLGFEII